MGNNQNLRIQFRCDYCGKWHSEEHTLIYENPELLEVNEDGNYGSK